MGLGRIAQHPLGHQLRGAIGIDRRRRRVLRERNAGRRTIDRRCRREHEVTNALRHAAGEQISASAGVVAIVVERPAHGFRNDDAAGEMHHGLDSMALDERCREPAVAHVTFHQHDVIRCRLPAAGRQVVENVDGMARLA